MPPLPLYQPADLRPAYQLRYGWTGWASKTPFPVNLLTRILPEIAPEWERDGLRVLESSLTAGQVQLTVSTTPQIAPVTLVRVSHFLGADYRPCRLFLTAVYHQEDVAKVLLGSSDEACLRHG